MLLKKIILSLVSILCGFAAVAQTYASGRLLDADTGMGVVGAVLEINNQRTPEKKRYYTSEIGGVYRIPALTDGTYHCKVTYMGCEDLEFDFRIVGFPKNLGDKNLKPSAIGIATVVKEVVAKRTTMEGDTLSYHADAFKVSADAEVEALLKKMPGITIKNGRIEAQGELVKLIYVDGKEFFGGNIQQVLQSIPAQAVERIEVFNRLSEAAQITGVDDGEGGKAINIVTRGSLKNSQFGKMYVGVGVEPAASKSITEKPKYLAGGSVNIFRGDRRISIMALANNINRQSFSEEDVAVNNSSSASSRNFSVNSQNGVAKAELLALNYIDRWGKRKRAKFEGSLFYNHIDSKNEYTIDRWYNAPAKIDTSHYDQKYHPNNRDFRFRGRLDWKVGKRQKLVLIPSLRTYKNSSESFADTTCMRWGESGVYHQPSWNSGYQTTISTSLYAQYSLRFLKHGRTAMIVASVSNTETENPRRYWSYSGKTWPVDPLTKYSYSVKNVDNSTWTIRVQPTWRERLGRYSTLNIAYRFQTQLRYRDIKHYSTAPDFVIDPDKLRPQTSSAFDATATFHQAGIGYRYGKHRNYFSINAQLQYTRLDTHNKWSGERSGGGFFHPVYNATLQWAFNKSNTLRITASSEVKNPNIWNLADIYDVTNTTYITKGNKDLKPFCEHNFFARYTNVSTSAGTTFMLMLKATGIQDYIGSNLKYVPGTIEIDGKKYNPIQFTFPVNLSGYWLYEARTSLGIPVKPISSNLNISYGLIYSTIPIIVNDLKDMQKTLTNTAQVTLGSNISENIDFTLDWNCAYSRNSGTVETMNNTYFTHTAKGDMKAVAPLGFTLTAGVSYTQYIGFTNNFRDSFVLCNLALGKKVLNSLGEIQFEVHDLLNQNRSFARSVLAGYSQIRYNSTMGRYFMVRFTYNLRSFSNSSRRLAKQQMSVPVNPLAGVQAKLDKMLKF